MIGLVHAALHASSTSVGHREQAMILLLDVLAQKADVTLGVSDESSDRFAAAGGGPFDCIGHASDKSRPGRPCP